MSGLVCWPGEGWSLFASIEGGTDVVLRVELVQSFFFCFLPSYACFVFYIHLIKPCLLYFDLQPVRVMGPVKPVRGKAEKVALDEGDLRELNITVQCSLRDIDALC